MIAHGAPEGAAPRAPGARMTVMLPADGVPTVAVLGAIGPDKGARRLERLVTLARERGARVRFVLIGYMDVQHGPWQSDDAVFTVHGRYDPADLPALLDHYRAALVLYPSAGPETFSYTLTEAWAAGRPVLVPPIGALAERVAGSGAGAVLTDDEWRDEARMLERIGVLLAPEGREALAAAARAARARPQAALADMAAATFALYERALVQAPAGAAAPAKPLAPARLRHALRYVPWHPPEVAANVPPPAGALARVGRTAAGRALARFVPAPLRAALRARRR